MTNTIKTHPTYLTRFEHWIDDVQFVCWMDYEAGDKSVGMNSSAWLVRAYIGDSGMDVSDFLNESTIKILQDEAAFELDQD